MKNKLAIILASFALLFSTLPVGAQNLDTTANKAEMIKIQESEYEAQAAGITIFFGGIVVGMVINGGIQYATGYSAEYWIAQGLHNIEAKLISLAPSYTPDYYMQVNRNGTVTSLCAISPCRGYDSIDPN